MRVLFLDDDPNRRRIAREYFAGHDLSEAETAQQAIHMLKKYSPYDLVHLDHDLGGDVFAPSNEVSGFHVAQFIVGMEADKLPKRVVVHSYNPGGANKMLWMLAQTKSYIPTTYEPFNLYRKETPKP